MHSLPHNTIQHTRNQAAVPTDKWPTDKWPTDKWPTDKWPLA